MTEPLEVLVIGDAAIDQLILRQPRSASESEFDWQRHPSYTFWEVPGGVFLSEAVLKGLGFAPRMISIPMSEAKDKRHVLKTFSRLAAAQISAEAECRGILGEDKLPERMMSAEGQARYHLRVKASEGYFKAQVTGEEHRDVPSKPGCNKAFPVVFLNDAGGVARTMPNGLALSDFCGDGTVILHKMHLPLSLHSRMVLEIKAINAAAKILVVTLNDLRADGTRLRASLSWPMFLEDLRMAAGNGLLASAREVYEYVVVLVGEDGAFAIGPNSTLVAAYDAGSAEGEHDAALPGDVYGKTNAFACALLTACTETSDFTLTDRALAQALATVRAYSARCLTVETLDGSSPPVLPLITRLAEPQGLRRVTCSLDATISTLTEADAWTKAVNYVRNGRAALSDMEHASFGDFLTVDRTEIEGFRAIRTVIDGYINDPGQIMPLSLAVFGPPGSGKSFGIKQLAKARPEIELRIFNLSEASLEALPGYFHEMRDVNLKGRMPLWFFDEFDSRGCELVARFLAPMQDGEMRDKSRLHPIGRGILVFAGGTACTAQQFLQGPGGSPDEARRLKIPDFVSRLAGIIDIRGINPVTTLGGAPDLACVLRRAILLRNLLERYRKDIAGGRPDELCIHDNLLTAFLKTSRYTHGARSMEKIVQAGALLGPRPIFGGSDLPQEGLLALHLKDPAAFLKMATGEECP